MKVGSRNDLNVKSGGVGVRIGLIGVNFGFIGVGSKKCLCLLDF